MKIRAQKTVSRELFWWLHIIFFGILGVLMVFFLDSGATIRLLCESLLSENRPGFLSALLRPEVLEALLLYGKCFIWSYELVFCLAFLLHGSLHGLKTAFAIAACFEAVLFLLQFFFFLHGNFLFGNLAAILLGDFISAVVILIHERALI